MLEKFKNKFKLLDLFILLVILIAFVLGYFTYRHIRQTADKQIEATSKVGFQVFLSGVTITSPANPIKQGDKTFVTIRNVPYTELEVLDVKADSRKMVMPSNKTKEPFVLMDDFSQMYLYDMVVSIVDTAKITKGGVVLGGNKLKIGLPITLEGKDYKFTGLVSDIQILPEMSAKDKDLDTHLKSVEDVQ